MLLKEKVVDYSVRKYLTTEEKRFLNECSKFIFQARRILYWPSHTNEKPKHVRTMEYNQRRIECLKAVAVKRLIRKLIFS